MVIIMFYVARMLASSFLCLDFLANCIFLPPFLAIASRVCKGKTGPGVDNHRGTFSVTQWLIVDKLRSRYRT